MPRPLASYSLLHEASPAQACCARIHSSQVSLQCVGATVAQYAQEPAATVYDTDIILAVLQLSTFHLMQSVTPSWPGMTKAMHFACMRHPCACVCLVFIYLHGIEQSDWSIAIE